MTPEVLYIVAGTAVFVTGLAGTLGRAHLFWKVLGVNFMGSGIFLVLLAGAPRVAGQGADPVPQAMVLTGIVVAAAATALALGMALRVMVRSGQPYLAEDLPPRARRDEPERASSEPEERS
jgi:multicomponent Na+:H+ antiporter subunit C